MDSFTLQVDNEQYIAFRRNLLAVEACHTPGRVEELEVMFAQRHDGLAGSVDDVEERRVVDTFDSECFHCLEGCGDRHFIGCVGTHAHCRRILADAFHGALVDSNGSVDEVAAVVGIEVEQRRVGGIARKSQIWHFAVGGG